MGEVLDTFELKHVSTTYSEDNQGNVLTHFNCRGNAAGFGLVYDTAIFLNLQSDAQSGDLTRIGHDEQAWKPEVVFSIDDGTQIRSVGELRLDTETHAGTNYSVDD